MHGLQKFGISSVEHDTRAGLSPTLALLTDDAVEAQRIWHAPDWFDRNVVCLWLCACDALDLRQIPTTICNATPPAAPSGSGLLQQAESDLLGLFHR